MTFGAMACRKHLTQQTLAQAPPFTEVHAGVEVYSITFTKVHGSSRSLFVSKNAKTVSKLKTIIKSSRFFTKYRRRNTMQGHNTQCVCYWQRAYNKVQLRDSRRSHINAHKSEFVDSWVARPALPLLITCGNICGQTAASRSYCAKANEAFSDFLRAGPIDSKPKEPWLHSLSTPACRCATMLRASGVSRAQA